jgi:hypothetical protein
LLGVLYAALGAFTFALNNVAMRKGVVTGSVLHGMALIVPIGGLSFLVMTIAFGELHQLVVFADLAFARACPWLDRGAGTAARGPRRRCPARARPGRDRRKCAGAWRLGWGRPSVGAARHEMGARVLAGILRPERAASVRAAGADAVIDLSAADLRDSLRAQVHAVTEGRGVDIILDPLGGTIFDAAVRALAWRGRLVVIGFATGAIATIKTNYLLLKNIEISGLQISDYRTRRPAQVAACLAEIFSLYEQGKVKPAAATAFPLARAGEALAALRDRRIAGRAVLHLRDD